VSGCSFGPGANNQIAEGIREMSRKCGCTTDKHSCLSALAPMRCRLDLSPGTGWLTKWPPVFCCRFTPKLFNMSMDDGLISG
jgi:hypothetical protein